MAAADQGHLEVVQALLGRGADVINKNNLVSVIYAHAVCPQVHTDAGSIDSDRDQAFQCHPSSCSQQPLPGELRFAPHAPSPGWHSFQLLLLALLQYADPTADIAPCKAGLALPVTQAC